MPSSRIIQADYKQKKRRNMPSSRIIRADYKQKKRKKKKKHNTSIDQIKTNMMEKIQKK